jgi:mitochondrial fusion and transport protein UGO1
MERYIFLEMILNIGANSTYLYSVLFDAIETWLSSLLAATFALPDPTLFDMLDSPTPGTSLAAALTATAIAAIILSPIDIYRITYLLITPANNSKIILPVSTARSPPPKSTPTPLIIPKSLVLPTLLHAVIPNYLSSLFTLSLRPYFPRMHFSPARYSLPFLASFLDLGIRLPLESILRRAQISHAKPERTIIKVAPYKGVVGTMWAMMSEERAGIFRGWRIGFWGLMMVWVLKTTDALGRGQDVEF